jgi:hypothetical protein
LDDRRESKKRLQEAVRQWAEWHGRHYVTVGSSLDRERDRERQRETIISRHRTCLLLVKQMKK